MAELSSESAPNHTGNQRLGWVDIARGIGMLLVIVGHTGIIDPLVKLAFSVHVPLFLMVSGFLFKPGRAGLPSKLARRLLIPYLCSGLVAIAAMAIIAGLKDDRAAALSTLAEWIPALAFGSGTNSSFFLGIHYIGAIWFLLALFLAQFIYNYICDTPYSLPVIIILFAAGYLSAKLIWLPWSVQPACVSLVFLHIGHEARKLGFDPSKIKLPVVLVSIVIWIAAIHFDLGKLYIVVCYFRNIPLDIAGAIAGTIVICWASYHLDKIGPVASLFKFMGRNSLAILCFQFIEGKLIEWEQLADALGFGNDFGAFSAILLGKLLWSNLLTFACCQVPLPAKLFGAVPATRKEPLEAKGI